MFGTESTPLTTALELFQLENRARRYSPTTIEFYDKRLRPFIAWCEERGATRLQEVTPGLLRAYLVASQERGGNHRAAGVHAEYGARPVYVQGVRQESTALVGQRLSVQASDVAVDSDSLDLHIPVK